MQRAEQECHKFQQSLIHTQRTLEETKKQLDAEIRHSGELKSASWQQVFIFVHAMIQYWLLLHKLWVADQSCMMRVTQKSSAEHKALLEKLATLNLLKESNDQLRAGQYYYCCKLKYLLLCD